jgi:hypothetical protein
VARPFLGAQTRPARPCGFLRGERGIQCALLPGDISLKGMPRSCVRSRTLPEQVRSPSSSVSFTNAVSSCRHLLPLGSCGIRGEKRVCSRALDQEPPKESQRLPRESHPNRTQCAGFALVIGFFGSYSGVLSTGSRPHGDQNRAVHTSTLSSVPPLPCLNEPGAQCLPDDASAVCSLPCAGSGERERCHYVDPLIDPGRGRTSGICAPETKSPHTPTITLTKHPNNRVILSPVKAPFTRRASCRPRVHCGTRGSHFVGGSSWQQRQRVGNGRAVQEQGPRSCCPLGP